MVMLYGPDAATSRDLADTVARQFADPANPLAIETLTGGTLASDPGALAGAAGAVSMFGDRTLVRIDGLTEDGLAAVEALLAGPPGNPVIAVAGALKKGSKLQALGDRAPGIAALVSYEPGPADALRLATTIGEDLGLRPSRDAAALLFDAAAGDRVVMRRELEKLALYLDADPARPLPLGADDVAALVPGSGDTDQFAIADAVAGGKAARASELLGRLGSGLGIVALRATDRRLVQLLGLRTAVDAGASPRAVVDTARPPVHFKAKDAMVADLAAWTTPALTTALAAILAAERAIKAPASPGDVLAHRTLLDLARRAAAARRR